MTEKNPGQQAQLLKEFLGKCAGSGSQYENFANANLSSLTIPERHRLKPSASARKPFPRRSG
jgi:hypothetical protein